MFAYASSLWTALPSEHIEGSMMKKKIWFVELYIHLCKLIRNLSNTHHILVWKQDSLNNHIKSKKQKADSMLPFLSQVKIFNVGHEDNIGTIAA